MGQISVERWLRDAAPLVPYGGEWWTHADPNFAPFAERTFWRQLAKLSNWQRIRTHVRGRPATLMVPNNGTKGLRLGFRKCHSEFEALAKSCAQELAALQKPQEHVHSKSGTYRSIKSSITLKNSKKIPTTHRASLRSAVCVEEKIQEKRISGEKIMKAAEVIAAHKEKQRKLHEEQALELSQSAETKIELAMLWKLLYSGRFGYASDLGAKQRVLAQHWAREFKAEFKAPVGLLWIDMFNNYAEVRKFVCVKCWHLTACVRGRIIDNFNTVQKEPVIFVEVRSPALTTNDRTGICIFVVSMWFATHVSPLCAWG